MSDYKHGAFGEMGESIGAPIVKAGTVMVYVGTAPVNLIRSYKEYVNAPVKLSNFNGAKRYMGYSDNWKAFDLCEPIQLHFNNADGNIGPIVAINVLNPDLHKKETETIAQLVFVNGRATINSDTIILDTLVVLEKEEGVDYSVDYDFTKGQVIIDSLGDTKITGVVDAVYFEVDPTMITKEDIIGGITANGEYSGLGCVDLVYSQLFMVPNHILCPGWSHIPAVYEAMIVAGSKINGHWDTMPYASIPIVDEDGGKVDTIEAAIKWKTAHGYNNELTKVFWPQAKDTSGRTYHADVLAAWRTMLVNATHNDLPMETPSNKSVPISAQYFGEDSTNRGFDQMRANELNAAGITTVVFWGGEWVLWGPHTAAYQFGAVTDNRNIFDNSIRMLMFESNRFQQEYATEIDKPMTRSRKDTILNLEQEKLDAHAAMGAYIGQPVISFDEAENSTADLVEGNFTFGFKGTPTPPFKSATLKSSYTTEGFDSYFGEEE